jgi:hypothetical protein
MSYFNFTIYTTLAPTQNMKIWWYVIGLKTNFTLHQIQYCKHINFQVRAPDNFQVQRVITPYFWKWCVFAYFLCTVVLSTSEKIAFERESVYIRGVPNVCLSKHRCQKRSDWMFRINHPIAVNITNKCGLVKN